MPDVAVEQEKVAHFEFHTVHPAVRFGTASDRYAGWIGQVYPPDFENEVKTRKRRLQGKTFEERTLPIASVRNYFGHFSILELDFTFYRPLKNPDGSPSNNHFVLSQYAREAPDAGLFFLKVPQKFSARTLRRSDKGKVRYVDNPDFLDAGAYLKQFHAPASEILGNRLVGVIFEQEYQRKSDGPSPEDNVAELDGFFEQIPNEIQAHLELRSPHLLTPEYFAWLESLGLGFVFSHWTWLPPIREQWKQCGERFSAADGNVITRLLTPLRMPYAEAYALAHPFDAPVPALCESTQARDMVLDVTALALRAWHNGSMVNIISNNRAWGNAPALAQAVAYRILEEIEKRPDLATNLPDSGVQERP